jgi:hypothetical protein
MKKYITKKGVCLNGRYRPASTFPSADLFASILERGKFYGEYEFDDYETPTENLQIHE